MAWEERLKEIFDRIDDVLEDKYGERCPLHPARPERGATSNPEQDGLFNIGAAFTTGYGSALGPGYQVDVRIATLKTISPKVQEALEAEVAALLREELPRVFPGKNLQVERDGHGYKIHGDLSLGAV